MTVLISIFTNLFLFTRLQASFKPIARFRSPHTLDHRTILNNRYVEKDLFTLLNQDIAQIRVLYLYFRIPAICITIASYDIALLMAC
jgi:hypothetical protein